MTYPISYCNFYTGISIDWIHDLIKKIRKRDGRVVNSDISKVAKAVFKAFLASNTGDGKKSEDIENQVA